MRIASALISGVVLSGCISGGAPNQSQLQPLPPFSKIELIGMQTYASNLGRSPRNFKVVKVNSASFWGSNDWDHYACMTATEKQDGNIYDSSWKLVSAEGSDYTETYIMTFRDYSSRRDSSGWSSGLFKRAVGGVKVGDRNARELCAM